MTKEQAHNQVSRHMKDLLLLFSVPVAIIVLLVGLIYIPRVLANPTYDFIYCEGYYCDDRFSIDPNGTLKEAPDESVRSAYRGDARLFYYDVQRDATRPVQFDEAARYRLDTTSKSPDGYTLKHNSNSSGFLFWGGSSRSWSLSKGFASQPVTLGSGYGDSKFIGWILSNGQ